MNARLLNTTNFLNFFTVFCLLLCVFVVTYFLFSLFKNRIGRRVARQSGTWAFGIDFITGAVFGTIAFLAFFLQQYFMGGIPTVLAIDLLLIIGWLLSAPFFWGMALPALGSIMYQRSLNAPAFDWVVNLAFFGLVLFQFVVFSLLRRRWAWLNGGTFFLFAAMVAHGLLAAGLYGYAVNRDLSVSFYLIAAAVCFLFTAFGYLLGLLVNRGLLGTRRLSMLARNDFEAFIKQPFAREELHSFIAQRGLSNGFLLSFFSNPIGEKTSLQQIYDAVRQKYAGTDCLLLSLASRYPTVFVPLKGDFRSVSEMTAATRSAASVAVVELMGRPGMPADFKAFFSIYGAHADSVKELLQINLSHMLSPDAFVGPRLSAYDPEQEFSNEAEVMALDAFLKTIDPADIEHVFKRFVFEEGKEVFLVMLMSVPMLAFTTEQCLAKIDQKYRLVAARYYAMQTLRDFFSRYQKGKVVVFYPLEVFMDRAFSLRALLAKLAAQNFDVKRVVFCLNLTVDTAPSAAQLRRLKEKLTPRGAGLLFAIVAASSKKTAGLVNYVVTKDDEIKQVRDEHTPVVEYHKKV